MSMSIFDHFRNGLILVSLSALIFSCHGSQEKTTTVLHPTVVAAIESDLLSEQDIQVLQPIKSGFDSILNINNTRQRPMGELYKFNSAGMSTSFFQQEPLSINFPYDNRLRLSQYEELLDDNRIWSYKCGYADSTNVTILNYYCLNTEGPIFDYFKALAPTNDIINAFVTDYLRAQDFTPAIQGQILMQGRDDLDFTNADHQLFWMIYHLSLNETMNAQKDLNQYRRSADAVLTN